MFPSGSSCAHNSAGIVYTRRSNETLDSIFRTEENSGAAQIARLLSCQKPRTMPNGFFQSLKTVATSPYAFVAYIVLVIGWVYVAVAQYRLTRISRVLSKVPPKDRATLLAREYAMYPRTGLSAEQAIRSRKHTLLFLGFLAVVLAAVVLMTIALNIRKDVINRSSLQPADWQMFLYLLKA